MKSTELRPSNLVLDDNENIIQITGVCNNCVWDGKEYEYIGLPLEECYPIQLTEEWLLKFGFGFRANEISKEWFLGHNPITIDWLFHIVWIDNDESPFYKNGFHKIKYIHQLQNLYFALTGEELTLK